MFRTFAECYTTRSHMKAVFRSRWVKVLPVLMAAAIPLIAVSTPAHASINFAGMLKDKANGQCLAADLSVVKLEPCNSSDAHMVWSFQVYLNYDLFQDTANSECLAADLSVVKLEPCNTADEHQRWSQFLQLGYTMFMDQANGEFLAADLSTVQLEPENVNDAHQLFTLIGTS